MLEVFANFQKIIPKINSTYKIPMGLDIWWVSEQPQPLDVIQNWVFVIMWLDFQPQKSNRKYEMCRSGRQKNQFILETPSISGQYGLKRLDKKKKIWNHIIEKNPCLKPKIAVWCSSVALNRLTQYWQQGDFHFKIN